MVTGESTMNTVAISTEKKYSSVHQRSVEKWILRNKAKKQRRKEKRKREYEAQKKEKLEKDEKLLLLERQNLLLKREVKKTRKVAGSCCNRIISMNSVSASMLHQNRNKNFEINRCLTSRITTCRQSDVIDWKDVHLGAFGSVSAGYIKSIQQRMAVKKIDAKSSSLAVLVEVKITSHLASLSGGTYFPYVYGITDSKCILLEFIGEDNKFSPNLHSVIEKCDISKPAWIQVLTEICKGFNFMHTKNILHNDIHSKNIVLRNKQFVKITDFGKATLISDPLRYYIKRGSERQKIFNTKHCHLDFELRNVPGSYPSIETDVFSIGYTFGKVAQRLKWEGLDNISLL